MRTKAKKSIKNASVSEVLSELTRSLAFQVAMIMWEDRERTAAAGRKNDIYSINRLL